MTNSVRLVTVVAPESAVEVDADRTISKVTRRLIPFLIVCYFTAYLDRVNIGFAALSMNQDLGFSPVLFGWGAGIFFIGYCLFEVPSNYILARVGARRWIARIMVSWGIVSGLMALTWNGTSFLILRFLLGLAEAGFAPGIILYFTYWIPVEYRARTLGTFLVAIPLSTVVGAPVSGLVLTTMHGVAGINGWQWLFIVEAVPSVILGIVAFFYLADKPKNADWLTPAERAWLQARLDREDAMREALYNFTLWQALRQPRVIVLSIAYFGIVFALYGLGLWLPQIVNAFGFGAIGTGFVTAIPYVCGAIAMVVWSKNSDHTGERSWHTALAAFVAASGLAASACFEAPATVMLALSFAATGILAVLPTFWTLPTAFLSGTAAAAGIALINSIGNLAGFFGPYLVGWIKSATGGFSWALLALAIGPVISAILILCLGHDGERKGRTASFSTSGTSKWRIWPRISRS